MRGASICRIVAIMSDTRTFTPANGNRVGLRLRRVVYPARKLPPVAGGDPGPRHAVGPDGTRRPVGGEPGERLLEDPRGDVAAGGDVVELAAAAENEGRDPRAGPAIGGAVTIGNMEELFAKGHHVGNLRTKDRIVNGRSSA